MSAGTQLSHPPFAIAPLPPGDLLIAGWPALVAVALAGLTLGFFGWYALIVPRHHGAIGELGLLAGIVGGIALPSRRGSATRATFRAAPASRLRARSNTTH